MPSATVATDRAYHVYVIELAPAARRVTRVMSANPDARRDRPVLYVGMTGRTPQLRFEQHMSGYKSSWLVRRHGLRLRHDLMLVHGVGPLATQAEGLAEEARLTEALREAGYAVWSN